MHAFLSGVGGHDQAVAIFRRGGGTLRTSEAVARGIHPRTLYQLRDAARVVELSRGVYRLAELPAPSQPDLVTVALRVPQAVVCLISALALHELTTEIPHEVYLALPRTARHPRLDTPPLRVFRFSGAAFTEGLETRAIDRVSVRVYGPAKTVADCFKCRHKVGLDVALEALKQCLARGRARPAELLRAARVCRVERVMRPYLEALA